MRTTVTTHDLEKAGFKATGRYTYRCAVAGHWHIRAVYRDATLILRSYHGPDLIREWQPYDATDLGVADLREVAMDPRTLITRDDDDQTANELRDEANNLSRAAGTLVLPAEYKRLRTLARAYAKIQERWCSEEMDEPTRLRTETREAQLEARIREWAAQHDEITGVIFGGDPRGYTVRLVLKSGRSNTWDGNGQWGIA